MVMMGRRMEPRKKRIVEFFTSQPPPSELEPRIQGWSMRCRDKAGGLATAAVADGSRVGGCGWELVAGWLVVEWVTGGVEEGFPRVWWWCLRVVTVRGW